MTSGPRASALPAALSFAKRVIRERTRAGAYWAAADRLSQLWLAGPLQSAPEFVSAAGPDLAAILDTLYEEAPPTLTGVEALPALTRRFQELVELEVSTRELRRYEAGPTEPGLMEAARLLLAALTHQGHAALVARGAPELAARWREAWADFLWKHNSQQQQVTGLGVLARLPPEQRPYALTCLGLTPASLVPASTSFAEGVNEFLDRYGETAASSMAILGSLPFSALPLDELDALLRLWTAPGGLLPRISRLFRLAQDVSFDPSEALSTGVFATAAEQRRGLLAVITEGNLSKQELDARLREAWTRDLPRARQDLEQTVDGSATLSAWLRALFQVLDRLVPGTWKD